MRVRLAVAGGCGLSCSCVIRCLACKHAEGHPRAHPCPVHSHSLCRGLRVAKAHCSQRVARLHFKLSGLQRAADRAAVLRAGI